MPDITERGGEPVTAAASPLREALAAAAAETGCPLKDLTVLSEQRDPFRLDTPANHRLGEWLAVTAGGLGLGDRRIHLRGLHYMMIGQPKPAARRYGDRGRPGRTPPTREASR